MLQCYNDFEISLRFSTLGFYPPPADRFAAEVNLGSWNNPVGFKIGDLRLEIFEYRISNIEYRMQNIEYRTGNVEVFQHIGILFAFHIFKAGCISISRLHF